MSLLRGWQNKIDIILLGQQGGCVAPTIKGLVILDFFLFFISVVFIETADILRNAVTEEEH